MKRRARGVMLVEVMLAVVATSALLGILAIAIGGMMRANTASQRHVQTIRALGQLGDQFRSDVHQATAATSPKSDGPIQELDLTLAAGQAIRYALKPEGVERTVLTAGQTGRREQFETAGFQPLGFTLTPDSRQVELSFGRLLRPEAGESPTTGKFGILATLPPEAAPTGEIE